MNPSGYAILIFAILLIVGAMLYARFFARSRKNSFEDPVAAADSDLREGVSPMAERTEDSPGLKRKDEHLFVLPPESGGTESAVEPSGFHHTAMGSETVVELPEVVAKPNQRKDSEESEYFDDLQDAAAGLAMLMRSSPVSRTSPVIFAPEEAGEIDDDAPGSIVLPLSNAGADPVEEVAVENIGEESVADVEPTEADQPVEEVADSNTDFNATETADEVSPARPQEDEEPFFSADIPLGDVGNLFDDSIELVIPEGAEGVDEDAVEEDEVAIGSELSSPSSSGRLRLLLGDEVGDQVDAIDQGLAELEDLVVNIESSLASLDMTLFKEDEVVSKAA